MTDFSADWLRLREPADHAARQHALTDRLVDWAASAAPVSVLDLGTGTGSNLRFLAPRLGHRQTWRLIDKDAVLLRALPQRLEEWATTCGYQFRGGRTLWLEGDGFSARIECQSADLQHGIGHLLGTPTRLVTASALLDLVSQPWLDQLVADCRGHGCAACFALNYDGQVQWQPAAPDDELLRQRLNDHQRQAKGLGLALGPAAGAAVAEGLGAAGLAVTQMASNWQLDRRQASLQIALARGWAEAVSGLDAGLAERASQWLNRREALADAADARVVVGHVDVLGLPAADS